ncbi:hypothetical protein ES319_D03G039000v1 [Gossypium barbadense]|uniref:Uncharacterized protein n=2 Tax=Gossypium TaxID=3633 RepID=A0A5J5S385_GOSBA|nr:hypothetical protein ES319_D03G039000v1 [Gossypium barbadense]TYG75587.1 hypothetical protein ES288_D03G043200v1 [Gossypium darwinii]
MGVNPNRLCSNHKWCTNKQTTMVPFEDGEGLEVHLVRHREIGGASSQRPTEKMSSEEVEEFVEPLVRRRAIGGHGWNC